MNTDERKSTMKSLVILLALLPGCAYRYGTGYFMNDIPVQHVPAQPPPPEPVQPEPVAQKPPCNEEAVKTTTLEVTNKLDQKAQTMTTTAVTETHESTKNPCPE